MFRAPWLACVGLILAGCGPIDSMLRPPDAPAVVRFEVWNRTLDPVFLLDADDRVLSVDACGHAVAEQLRVNKVDVRMDAGIVFSFSGASVAPTGAPQYLVVVAAVGESVPSAQRPVGLPACHGHPNVLPGP